MEIHLIWAQDSNGGIGKKGTLPWHISEDLKNFKKITLNATIIMGRKTWDSLPLKPLPQRDNIVISSTKQNKATTLHSYKVCIEHLEKENIKKVFIIGGRSIYKLFFKHADYLHITQINLLDSGIDEFFPITMKNIKIYYKKISEKHLSKHAMYTYWKKK